MEFHGSGGATVAEGSHSGSGTNWAINQEQRTVFNTLDARFPRQFAHELNIKASRQGNAHPDTALYSASAPAPSICSRRNPEQNGQHRPEGGLLLMLLLPGEWANKIKVGNTRK